MKELIIHSVFIILYLTYINKENGKNNEKSYSKHNTLNTLKPKHYVYKFIWLTYLALV